MKVFYDRQLELAVTVSREIPARGLLMKGRARYQRLPEEKNDRERKGKRV